MSNAEITRREALKRIGASILALSLSQFPQSLNANEVTPERGRYPEKTDGIFCINYEQTVTLLDHFGQYPSGTNLIKVTRNKNYTCVTPEVSFYAPVGRYGNIGSGEEILPDSWYTNAPEGVKFEQNDFVEFAARAGALYDTAAQAIPSLADKERKIYFLKPENPEFEGYIDDNLPGLGIAPCIRQNWHMGLNMATLPGPHDPSDEREYLLDNRLYTFVHELFHGGEADLGLSRYYGKEAFANAFALSTSSDTSHALHTSDSLNRIRTYYADDFFKHKSLALFQEGIRSQQGYEHHGLIELFMKESGLTWPDVMTRLFTLPCISGKGLYQDPFPVIFPDVSWPESFGTYLAHVLMPPGVNRYDTIFDPLRTKLSKHISDFNINTTIKLGPKEFAFYMFDQSQDPNRYYFIDAPKSVVSSTFTKSMTPTNINPGSVLWLYNNPQVHKLPIALVNTETTDAYVSLRPKPDSFKLEHTYVQYLSK